MTTRRILSFFKGSDSNKVTEQVRVPQNEEDNNQEYVGPLPTQGTSHLHRSHSGRLKVKNKQRLSIARNTFDAPEGTAQSAPVIMTRADMGLTGRDLTKLEGNRVGLSLNPMNFPGPNPRDSPTPSAKTHGTENRHPESDFIDEIF